jgi:hypothetical protein
VRRALFFFFFLACHPRWVGGGTKAHVSRRVPRYEHDFRGTLLSLAVHGNVTLYKPGRWEELRDSEVMA